MNRAISIVSIGFYGPQDKNIFPVHYEVEVKLQDYEHKVLFGAFKKSVYLKNAPKVFHVDFEAPVKLIPNIWHTITFSLKVRHDMCDSVCF